MNPSALRPAAAAVAAVALVVSSLIFFSGKSSVLAAQDPPPQAATPQGPPPGGQPPHEMPKPKNLKVLPKDFTGKQVHDTMEKWAGQLGTHCNFCHVADPNRKGPNGRPMLNFADDSKKEKKTARIMYKMVQDINSNYVMTLPDAKGPVTCGTCHRGHTTPEDYVPALEDSHGHP